MATRPLIVGQLSSVHSSDADLAPARVAGHLDALGRACPLDVLIVGWTERPALYRALTAPGSRPAPEIFLWYPLLSDYPGFEPSHLVVDLTASRSRGWGGYEGTGIAESFKQSCPNNPDTVAATLGALERCLETYPFDGVFLDKIRFPSPANGLQDVFTCFCPHCIRKAADAGLDLEAVRTTLAGRIAGAPGRSASIPRGAPWLEPVGAGQPPLRGFIRFRADSVTALITEAATRIRALGRKVSLDVFSPLLAPLVGQDFPALAPLAEWAKPMIYRFGRGPSSLRSELPALIRELGAYLGRSEAEATAWAGAHVDGLAGQTVAAIEAIAPLSLIRAETVSALSLFAPTPVYLGLETVSIPGLMEVTPGNVEEILAIGSETGVHGYVLSWDVLHTPPENVRPLRALVG